MITEVVRKYRKYKVLTDRNLSVPAHMSKGLMGYFMATRGSWWRDYEGDRWLRESKSIRNTMSQMLAEFAPGIGKR